MEQALVLIVLAFSYPSNMIDEIKNIPGVTEANFIYGPYDLYVIVKTKTKKQLRDAVIRLREIEGISSTMTCNVV
jgi:DNA-binding Lrp family transcriptional regulator